MHGVAWHGTARSGGGPGVLVVRRRPEGCGGAGPGEVKIRGGGAKRWGIQRQKVLRRRQNRVPGHRPRLRFLLARRLRGGYGGEAGGGRVVPLLPRLVEGLGGAARGERDDPSLRQAAPLRQRHPPHDALPQQRGRRQWLC